mgnify:CR=1 FL=1
MKSWKNACASDLKTYEGICRVFSNHEYLLDGFFEKAQARLSSTPELMIERTASYSHGEVVLIKVALDIWSGSGNVFVWQILETLDRETFANVIDGLVFVKHDQQTLIGRIGDFS